MGSDFRDFSISGISLVNNNFQQKRKNRKCLQMKFLFAKKKHLASEIVLNL